MLPPLCRQGDKCLLKIALSGLRFQFGGGTQRCQAARNHDADAVRQGFRFLKVVGGQDKGDISSQTADDSPKFPTRQHIQPQRGFVQKENFGACNQRHGNAQTPLHTAGKGGGTLAGCRRQVQPVDHLQCGAAGFAAPHAIDARHEDKVFTNAQVGRHGGFLRRKVDQALDGGSLTDDAFAQQPRIAAGGAQQTAEHVDDRGLSSAVYPSRANNSPCWRSRQR